MAVVRSFRNWLAALAVTATVAGCAVSHAPNCDCGEPCNRCCPLKTACGVYHGTLADEVVCITGCLGQGRPYCGPVYATCGPECDVCPTCPLCPFGLERPIFTRPQPGPPPVRLREPLPAKFLPVPTAPILSPVRRDAPEPTRGEIETGYRPQLYSPGRD